MTSGGDNEWADVLTELASNEIYTELNKNITTSDDSLIKHCKDLKTENDGIKTLCKKIERNLKKLSETDKIKKERYRDRCLYFNWWVFDEIYKASNRNEGKPINTSDIDKLLLEWNEINYYLINQDYNKNYESLLPAGSNAAGGDNNGGSVDSRGRWKPKPPTRLFSNGEFSKYKPCFYNPVCTLDRCKDIKELYDYFKKFEKIKENISTKNEKCEKYNKYLAYIKVLYEKHKKEYNCCDIFWGNLCQDYFKCEKEYDPNNLLRSLKCDSDVSPVQEGEISEDRTTITAGAAESPRPNISTSSEPENQTTYKFLRCKEMKNDILPTYAACREVSAENYHGFDEVFKQEPIIDPFKNSVPKKVAEVAIKEEVPMKSFFDNLNIQSIVENPKYFKTGVSVLLILGIFSISFVYYKFTPLGLWLNKRGHSKKNRIPTYYPEIPLTLPSNSPMPVPPNFQNERIRLAYHSS
ncbi:VIR protein [Plasmodium vivax]|uniref:VIR protein n=1 Tax=Plasmodium vivax TaxID=5855 RepID=A0A1G4HB56_PLAVI|nr:VIR protein [Plasmodium vivax]